jgi:hypothetical protein
MPKRDCHVHQHTKHRRWIFCFFVLILALTVATPVLADYLGPNRTVTETTTSCKIVLRECHFSTERNEWKYKTTGSWSCSLEGKPWQAYSSNSRPCNDTLHTNGYEYWDREDVTHTQTNTYPPATINSVLQNCTLRNGWCITQPQLALNGLEPVAGHSIFMIEGTRNGQIVACYGASCTLPLLQGNNNFAYWALSSFGDSSTMGTLTANVDTQLPSISGTFTGTPGLNGWYLGPVTFTGSASDAVSGLASFTCILDGVPLVACNLLSANGEGPHTFVLNARDNAGHIQTLTRNAPIDIQNPSLNASINGTLGSNTWYTSATLNASASDPAPGSGLAGIEYNLDGSGWITFPASGTLNLPDGKHNVDLRAADKAGRTVSSSKSFWLDPAAPNLNLDSSGTSGLNGWYITSPTLSASANDDISGLELLEYNIDNNTWIAYTTPFSLSDGIHSVSVWAQDQAGLVTQVDRTYQVDTRAPQIAGSLSGTPGMNGWYISEVVVSASASDPLPGSDIDAFVYTLNGSVETAYTDPLILSDGQHTVQLSARDKAGLSHSIEQAFYVDTMPPSMTVDTALPNWVKGAITFNGTAGDQGSGLSAVEISFDSGQTWQAVAGIDSWSHLLNTADGPNGFREIRVRAVDQAGLTTEQTLNLGVDNQLPEISLPGSWLQWDTVTLNILDAHSGLSEARVEISDPKGRWPVRVIPLDPAQFPLDFKWDRRFGDDTIAEAGTYDVKVFASDQLGNSIDKSASIQVLLEILPPGPTSTQAYTATPATSSTHIATQTSSPSAAANIATTTPSPRAIPTMLVRVFGTIGSPVQTTPTPSTVSTPRATPTQSNAVDWLQSVFIPNTNTESTTEIRSPEEPTPPVSTSNSVLWGTAATAAIAAATAYVQEEKRKREEEKARQEALEARQEERREKMKEKKTAKNEEKRAQEEAWEQARLEKLNSSDSAHTEAKIARMEHEQAMLDSLKFAPPVEKPTRPTGEDKRAERKEALIEQETNSYSAKPQDWKDSYDIYMAQKAREEAARKAQEAAATQPKKKKTWLDKAWDFVDEHQTEIALGIGIVTGVAVVALTGGLALPLVAAAALAGSATLAAGATAAAMTITLNNHYDRPWQENLLTNVTVAGSAALAVSAVGFLLQAAATGIGSYCALHPSTCARVEPVFKALDVVEETWLKGKLTYQTWTGNATGAAETAFELHSEYADGGMPGNAVFKELGEQVTHLSKNAAPVIQKYGKDVIPLLIKHGDEGLALIQKFGLDGITLLQKHGNDATDLVHLDKDVLDYVLQQSDEAVAALSRWSAADLRDHGLELALRAQKDADVLADVKKLTALGPINPDKLTDKQKELIDKIAVNSTQYADNGQVVLGKWIDIDSGFVETAKDTGSVHYNPHPDMWNMLGNLGKANQEEAAWLINKQVVQKGIDKGQPFEYTLNGVPSNILDNEHAAVEAIFSGKSEAEIKEVVELEYMPIRMKELQELQKVGYELTFDEVTNSYILMLP